MKAKNALVLEIDIGAMCGVMVSSSDFLANAGVWIQVSVWAWILGFNMWHLRTIDLGKDPFVVDVPQSSSDGGSKITNPLGSPPPL